MPTVLSFLIIIAQMLFIVWVCVHLMRSFNTNTRSKQRFKTWHLLVEALILFGLIACFYNVRMSSFYGEPLFTEFSVLTGISIIFYFLSKVSMPFWRYSRELNLIFVGTLFWLSALTALKFTPYMPYVWFPLLGLFAITPFILSILCLTEIRYRNVTNQLSMVQILLLGLIPILAVELYTNTYTETPWTFIQIFDPSNTSIF